MYYVSNYDQIRVSTIYYDETTQTSDSDEIPIVVDFPRSYSTTFPKMNRVSVCVF